MLNHAHIWDAIDRLARDHGFSPSGLARKSGLDPTTFNKSKRVTREGKLRWPSTESIAKILGATGASLGDFLAYIEGGAREGERPIPILGMAQAGSKGYFDDAGYPVGTGWDEVPTPFVTDEHAYALEISGDSMNPVYRDGDIVIVSPSSGIRRGDRVVLRTKDGEVMAKQLRRKTANRIELQSLNPDYEDRTLEMSQVDWIARIIWAQQ
ncbi:S24 family peptidase [Varunaivibrio sulfuroxidans]|uniref:Phage repressor protein C with HTH and peptisase S24 domain n=1 Tax=Varunaivibrio sulfuroxidans TaxID=1773489 RepID=A0A4R3J765_9PROT|nr:helix-turn-helix transcriptional regulator [Varunaivibrio sulfuroxidans]TCS61698.1 phage repressor protein C with HTH and peptisase S24 domain [Varunaivibrio sulfuroxidans]WES32118.1 helix-turn-helix transcriptional regulator [Varunaivibrio sulfuroxidans]